MVRGKCPVCREGGILTKHHVIPKSVTKLRQKNILADEVVMLCRDCHDLVHESLVVHLGLMDKGFMVSRLSGVFYQMAKKFLKGKYPEVWKDFKDFRNASMKEVMDFYRKECEEEEGEQG